MHRLALFAALALAPSVYGADPELRRVTAEETALIGALSASAVLAQFVKAPAEPRWASGVLFDDAVRDALRASSPQARANAATASDFGYFALALYPAVVDAGLVTWLGRGKADLAVQLAFIDVEAVAINGLLTAALQRTVGRARPFTRDCATNPHPECTQRDRNTSFVSGHASVAFTGATVLCFEHSRLSLYGAADAAVCPIALAVAGTTGVLRVVADKHYATDVIAGAAIGALVGAGVSAFHFPSSDGIRRGLTGTQEGRGVAYFVRF